MAGIISSAQKIVGETVLSNKFSKLRRGYPEFYWHLFPET